MTKVKQMKTNTIKPVEPFKSLDEEANFWDTHSVVDEINDGTVMGFHQANKTSTITIRFQPEFLQELRSKAQKKGVGPTTLARIWIMEKLEANI